MGKKAVAIIGSANEEELKKKTAEKLHQKKLRQGKGERVMDTTEESLRELEVIEKKQIETSNLKDQLPTSKVKKSRTRSKPYQTAKAKVDVTKTYATSDAIKLLRDISLTKFDATVELHLVLKEKGISKEIELPHSTGKVRKIAVADDEFIKKLESGHLDLNLDSLYASLDQMGKLVKFAKVLGPKGLMPNPKNGTVVPDPAKSAAAAASKTSVILKTEKDAPLIHTSIGKLSASDQQLTANIKAILVAFEGKLIKAVLKSTMSPAIKLVLP